MKLLRNAAVHTSRDITAKSPKVIAYPAHYKKMDKYYFHPVIGLLIVTIWTDVPTIQIVLTQHG